VCCTHFIAIDPPTVTRLRKCCYHHPHDVNGKQRHREAKYFSKVTDATSHELRLEPRHFGTWVCAVSTCDSLCLSNSPVSFGYFSQTRQHTLWLPPWHWLLDGGGGEGMRHGGIGRALSTDGVEEGCIWYQLSCTCLRNQHTLQTKSLRGAKEKISLT
jgi:hypothetical protein